MEKKHLTIQNYNNKLQADCFLHIFKTLGNWDGNDMIDSYQYTFNDDTTTLWKLTPSGIGVHQIKNMPNWMIKMSHNLSKEDFMKVMKIEPEHQVYWMIFERIIE